MDAFGIGEDTRDLAEIVDPEWLRRRQLGPAWRRWRGRCIDWSEGALRVSQEAANSSRTKGNAHDATAVVDVRGPG